MKSCDVTHRVELGDIKAHKPGRNSVFTRIKVRYSHIADAADVFEGVFFLGWTQCYVSAII